MKRNKLLTAILTLSCASFTAAYAQSPDGSPGSEAEEASALTSSLPITPRYLVTYMNSVTTAAIDSATAVSVTNNGGGSCRVRVEYFKGFVPGSPVCTSTADVNPGVTRDFCSRNLPFTITTCNTTCGPELIFDEGKAIVSSSCARIGVEARVYYTEDGDSEVSAVSNSKIVRFGEANRGD